jgi:hypothetical protein
VPEVIPVTTPAAETVAIAVVPLLHVPPLVASVSVVADPSQKDTGAVGLIAVGAFTTVTTSVAEQPPDK